MSRKRVPVPQMRGVSAFLSTTSEPASTESASDAVASVSLEKIHFPARQPRRYFDLDKLEQLTESIKQHGILEPLLVRPLKAGEYELVAGERRYKAAQAAGLKEVPITVRELSDQEALQIALIENLQREDLNPIEETEGVLELLALKLECSKEDILDALTQMATAQKKGVTLSGNVSRRGEAIAEILQVTIGLTPESFRTSRVPLLSLPADVLEVIRQGNLEYTKARAIARVKGEQNRTKLLRQAVTDNLSLSEIKTRIQELKPKPESTPENILAERLSEIGKRLRKDGVWSDQKKRNRIAKLLDELERLTAEN